MGSLDGTGNAVFGAQFVAIERIARDCRPRAFVRVRLAFIGALEHDGKGRTRANGVVLVVFYVFGQGDGLLGGQIATVQPHAAARPCLVIRRFDRRLRRNHHATRATRRSLLVLQVQLTWCCSGRRGQARAISLGQVYLFEYKVVASVGIVLFVEGENGAIRLQEYQLAIGVRRALGDSLALRAPVGIRPIQGKLGSLDCLAVLVDLLDLGRRQGGEVELERHVRCARAALQIEEAQLVLGAVAEGVAGEVGGVRLGGFELCLDVGFFDFLLGSIRAVNMTDFHFTGSKVDLKRCFLVNAAQVTHEHTIDIDPHVVVARELKNHVLVFGGLATVRLDKLRGHGHAKVVVKLIVLSVLYSYRREVFTRLGKNLVSRVKGEELT